MEYNNFNKTHLSPSQEMYCLGTEKLDFIRGVMEAKKDYRSGMTVLIPFGGPGSIAHYFDNYGISTLVGDIEFNRKYSNPNIALKEFRDKSNHTIGDQFFIAWNAKNLPLRDDSQDIAVVNPPFGVECKVSENPMDLSLKCLGELARVLKIGGVAYYVIPNCWINEFIDKSKSIEKVRSEILCDNISSNPNSKLPLCLIRIVKSVT